MAKGEGAMEASMVKAYVCKAAEWVTREAMQIHGGMGYAEEFPVSRLFVDARVLSIFEGADETLCLKVIARQLVAASTLDSRPRVAARRTGREFVGEIGERADALERRRRDGRRRGRRGSGAGRPRSTRRCPSSPSRRRRRCGPGRSRRSAAGRGRRSPDRAWRRRPPSLSTTQRIATCGPSPTWQTSRGQHAFDLAARVRHHAHRDAGRGEPIAAPRVTRGSPTARAARDA